MKASYLVVLLAAYLGLSACVGPTPAPTPTMVPVPPAGGEKLRVQWIEVDAPYGHKLNAAVFRPSGQGPFPVVVVLHGTAGFVTRTALLGEDFVRAGFLAVAGCWFSGSGEKSPAPPTPISCPNGPPFRGSSLNSITYVKTLISVARMLSGANSERVGLIGVSRGASAALLVASTDGVQAVVSDSAPYIAGTRFDTAPLGLVQSLAAPVLMLHGTADKTVPVEVAREYEHALRQWNKPFEVQYYEGAPHAVTIYSGTRADARRRAIGFLTKHLASAGRSSKGS